MNPFGRKDTLAATVASTLDRHRNMSLKEYLEEANPTHSNPQIQHADMFYLEKPENLERVNAFIKRFLEGTFTDRDRPIRHVIGHLHQVGLSVEGYKGEDGTYDVYQFGRPYSTYPISGDADVDSRMFPRGNIKGNLKIKRTLMPGGQYMIDAELYMSKA